MKHKKLLVTLLVILGLGLGGLWSIKSGTVERVLSTTAIPFNWFVKPPEKLHADKYAIHNTKSPDIKASKKVLATYTNSFSLNKKTYPEISHLFNSNATQELSKIYDAIYGRPNTYIAHSCVSGMFVDYAHSWQPIVTLSVVDDSNKIVNQSYVFVINKKRVVDILQLGRKTAKYWTEPISDNYNFAHINQAQNKIETLFNTNTISGKGIKISKQAQNAQAYLQASVASQIIVTDDPNMLQFVFTVPVKEKLVYLTVTYNQNSNSIQEIN